MEKETVAGNAKVRATALEAKAAETAEAVETKAVETVEEAQEESTTLKIVRSTYSPKGSTKTYFNYFVKGELRGREVKAEIVPFDVGGYALLDGIVFADCSEADLILIPFKNYNERTNQTTRGNYYEAHNTDGQMVYRCRVKPKADSDKAYLEMLIAKAKI